MTSSSSSSSSKPVCVVRGSINNDEYFYGTFKSSMKGRRGTWTAWTERNLRMTVDEITKPGETKSSKRHASRAGGKGANQAVAIAKAGGDVRFYGTVGRDGVWVKEEMKGHGIDVGGIIESEVDPTGRAIIQISDDGENSIILFAGANHSDAHEVQKEALASSSSSSGSVWFPGATHLLLQNEIAFRSTITSLERAKSEGLCTIFNPSPMPSPAQIREVPWEKVEWLLINEGEGQALWLSLAAAADATTVGSGVEHAHVFGVTPEGEMGRDAAVRSAKEVIGRLVGLHEAFGRMNVVYTLGGEGVLAYVPSLKEGGEGLGEECMVYVPAATLRGVERDTTGAGDCFTGYFVAGLMGLSGNMRREDVVKLLAKCNQAAGMSVEKAGTIDSYPSNADVEARMSS